MAKRPTANEPKTIQAELDGKGLGNGINALAAEGKIEGVLGVYTLPNGEIQALRFNSCWAYTDWKRARGYYSERAHELPAIRMVELLPEPELAVA